MKKCLSLIQMDVHVNEVEYNYARVQELLSQALSEKPDIIVLPETWNTGFHPSKDLINISDRNGERTKALLSTFAKEHNVNIVGGSVAVAKEDLVFNTSYAYNREGKLVGEYSKMHGFSPAKRTNTSLAVRIPLILNWMAFLVVRLSVTTFASLSS